MELSLIVPVYNGEKTLPDLNRKIKEELGQKYSYEVIYVFDCGKDKSWELIQDFIREDPDHIRGFRLKQNSGQHKALLFGMTKAAGELVITLDEDLQHDPVYIDKLVKIQKEESFDVVYGKFEKLEHPGMRIRTSEMLRRLLKILVPGIFPDYSPYRLIKRNIACTITGFRNSYSFIDGYLGWSTGNIGSVSIKHCKRADGKSSYSYLKLFRHALLIIIDYSKIKTRLLFASLILNTAAIGIYFIFQDKGGILSTGIIPALFFTGIVFLVLGLGAEIIHYGNLKLGVKEAESE